MEFSKRYCGSGCLNQSLFVFLQLMQKATCQLFIIFTLLNFNLNEIYPNHLNINLAYVLFSSDMNSCMETYIVYYIVKASHGFTCYSSIFFICFIFQRVFILIAFM